jgi:hypothetical protein
MEIATMGQLLSLNDYGNAVGGIITDRIKRLREALPNLKLRINVAIDLPATLGRNGNTMAGEVSIEKATFTIYSESTGKLIGPAIIEPRGTSKIGADEYLDGVIAMALEELAPLSKARWDAAQALLRGEPLTALQGNPLFANPKPPTRSVPAKPSNTAQMTRVQGPDASGVLTKVGDLTPYEPAAVDGSPAPLGVSTVGPRTQVGNHGPGGERLMADGSTHPDDAKANPTDGNGSPPQNEQAESGNA